MARTGYRIYRQVAESDEAPSQTASKKGRNSAMIEARNNALFHRYYYHARIKKTRLEPMMEALAGEFFLTRRHLGAIIYDNADALKQVCDQGLTARQLTNLFPAFNWR